MSALDGQVALSPAAHLRHRGKIRHHPQQYLGLRYHPAAMPEWRLDIWFVDDPGPAV